MNDSGVERAKMNLLSKRFTELLAEADIILGAHTMAYSEWRQKHVPQIDENKSLGWRLKATNAIEKTAGVDSTHSRQFKKAGTVHGYETEFDILKRQRAVLEAVKDDHDGGFLSSARSLARAEVFDTELEVATELLQQGYKLASAVIARTVLETTLRGLCDMHGVPLGKLDTMNAALVKQQVYSVMVQKKVTWLSDIGNSAAHGKPEKFSEEDVADMMTAVERFVADFPNA